MSFQVIQGDAQEVKTTDELRSLRELVLQSEDSYPGIGAWWKKIKYGFKEGTRKGLLIPDNQGIVTGGTIVKLGETAKFCTMRMKETGRGQGYGQRLWDATLDLIRREGYDKVFMTMPGDVWAQGWFAMQRGIKKIGELPAKDFRRNDIEEIICECKL